jgi:hypothetical protein
MEKISREEASFQLLKRYFTGDPCKHGHVCERYVASDACLECQRIAKSRWLAKHPKLKKSKTPKKPKKPRRYHYPAIHDTWLVQRHRWQIDEQAAVELDPTEISTIVEEISHGR